jgi:hypothetical protein
MTHYKSTILSRVEERPLGEYDENGDVLACRKVKSRFSSTHVLPGSSAGESS